MYDSLPDKCVLLCHEKPEADGSVVCHRRLVAEWLMKHCNVDIPEWLPPDEREDVEQQQRKQQMLDSLTEF